MRNNVLVVGHEQSDLARAAQSAGIPSEVKNAASLDWLLEYLERTQGPVTGKV